MHPLRNPPAPLRPARGPRPPRRRPLSWVIDDAPPAAVGAFARDRPLALVEAALMLADEPLSARRLAAVAGLDAAETKRLVLRLRDLYAAEGSAFGVEELAGGYQLLTRPEFHPWLARLRPAAPAEAQLTAAARETLAIVAYRQPVTRADVEAIRGVGSNDVLERLLEKGLIRPAGRDDSLGRPTLYETTKKFLQTFGLRGLRDLPAAEGLAADRKADAEE